MDDYNYNLVGDEEELLNLNDVIRDIRSEIDAMGRQLLEADIDVDFHLPQNFGILFTLAKGFTKSILYCTQTR